MNLTIVESNLSLYYNKIEKHSIINCIIIIPKTHCPYKRKILYIIDLIGFYSSLAEKKKYFPAYTMMADPLFAKKYQPRREYGEKQSWNKKSWPKNVKTLTCPNHQMKKKKVIVYIKSVELTGPARARYWRAGSKFVQKPQPSSAF